MGVVVLPLIARRLCLHLSENAIYRYAASMEPVNAAIGSWLMAG